MQAVEIVPERRAGERLPAVGAGKLGDQVATGSPTGTQPGGGTGNGSGTGTGSGKGGGTGTGTGAGSNTGSGPNAFPGFGGGSDSHVPGQSAESSGTGSSGAW